MPLPAALVREAPDGLAPEGAVNAGFGQLDQGGGQDPAAGLAHLLGDAELVAAIMARISAREDRFQLEWVDGDEGIGRRFSVGLARLAEEASEGRPWLLTLVDHSLASETERSLRSEMLRDGLTGLPNRTAFIESLDCLLAQHAAERHAVLMLDLVRFSQVNESVGSLAGDQLIISIARRLVSTLRSGDMLARIGGDEFCILLDLPEGAGDALHAARRIHAALMIPFRLSELEIRVDCAIGCALLTEGVQAEDVVRNAQFALKRAKQSGRVEIYQQGDGFVARRRFSIETELRRAIEKGELRLAYQPLIDLQAERVAGFEALARWDHPEEGVIPPSEFIPVAEESGLIVPLGRWALHEALRTLAGWDREAGRILPVYVGVNVSAVQLARDDVPTIVRNALETHGVHGSRLMLELTESAIIADPDRSTRMLRQLKALNANIAMDDFGTGYSSLAYLQRLPIDLLKIDRSFVVDMPGNRDSVAIVRAILSLAAALGMNTTAEGVESAEVADTLAALGCSYGQGYHFARPLSGEQAYALLTERAPLSVR